MNEYPDRPKEISAFEAKTHLSELLERAQAGEEIVIAKANRPVVRLVPVTPRPKKRIAGLNAGGVYWMSPDFDAPLPDEFWDGDPNDALNTWIREQERKRSAARKRRRRSAGRSTRRGRRARR